MSANFQALKIIDKREETPEARSFILEIPEGLKDHYSFTPGQYLTVRVNIGGKEYRRAYSIFTAPFEDDFGFTVKRLKNGTVSEYIIESLNVGDTIEVMEPEGRFVVYADSDVRRDHYFFAAGSGITPVISMIKTIAEKEPQSMIYLLYGSRDEESIIFRNALDYFAELYADQIDITYILSQPDKRSGLTGLFRKKSTWRGPRGRIDAVVISDYLEEHQSKSGNDLYYLCGPGDMILTCEKALTDLGIQAESIKKEHFTNTGQETDASTGEQGEGALLKVQLNGESFELPFQAGKTVLETLIDEGKDPPYSCTSGACSTCVAKVLEGEVKMDVCFALDDDEIDNGYILTCQSRPVTPVVSIDFED